VRPSRGPRDTPVSKCGAVPARRNREGVTPVCSRKNREKLPGVENPRSVATEISGSSSCIMRRTASSTLSTRCFVDTDVKQALDAGFDYISSSRAERADGLIGCLAHQASTGFQTNACYRHRLDSA
jgi:hypothetical protein